MGEHAALFTPIRIRSPHMYVTLKRLQRAKDLLASPPNLLVVNVGVEVGMSHSHFSRTFVRAFGLAPWEFWLQSRTH